MAVAVGHERQLAEDLFTEHSRLVYAYCLRRLGSPEEAEDALQATYLNACRFLMRGFEPDVGQAWLLRVAHNVCVSRIRTKSRRRLFERPQDLQAVEELLPAREVADDELFGLEEALAGMPEQQRRAILLREWQGLSYREVAAELGLTQSAVETLIFRARRSLAKALETAAPRPRFVHAFHPAALLGSLKSGLATGVAIAASVTVVASTPIVADGAPRVFAQPAPAPPVAVPVAQRVSTPAPAIEGVERFDFKRGAAAKVKPASAGPKAKRPDRGKGKALGQAKAKRQGPPAWAKGPSKRATPARAKRKG